MLVRRVVPLVGVRVRDDEDRDVGERVDGPEPRGGETPAEDRELDDRGVPDARERVPHVGGDRDVDGRPRRRVRAEVLDLDVGVDPLDVRADRLEDRVGVLARDEPTVDRRRGLVRDDGLPAGALVPAGEAVDVERRLQEEALV